MPEDASVTLPDAPHADATVLDNAPWHSLTGPHASFAIGDDLVRRYPEDVAPFVAVRSWDEPEGWEFVGQGEGVQLVETDALRPQPYPEAVLLGAADVPEMLAIVERNQ